MHGQRLPSAKEAHDIEYLPGRLTNWTQRSSCRIANTLLDAPVEMALGQAGKANGAEKARDHWILIPT